MRKNRHNKFSSLIQTIVVLIMAIVMPFMVIQAYVAGGLVLALLVSCIIVFVVYMIRPLWLPSHYLATMRTRNAIFAIISLVPVLLLPESWLYNLTSIACELLGLPAPATSSLWIRAVIVIVLARCIIQLQLQSQRELF